MYPVQFKGSRHIFLMYKMVYLFKFSNSDFNSLILNHQYYILEIVHVQRRSCIDRDFFCVFYQALRFILQTVIASLKFITQDEKMTITNSSGHKNIWRIIYIKIIT